MPHQIVCGYQRHPVREPESDGIASDSRRCGNYRVVPVLGVRISIAGALFVGFFVTGAASNPVARAAPSGPTAQRPRVVALASTTSGHGYWTVSSTGVVSAFGDAHLLGDLSAVTLVSPVVGMAVTPDGNGYWLAASDGGVFAFGDAVFVGSAVGHSDQSAITAITPTATGRGYWLLESGATIDNFGDASVRNFGGLVADCVASAPVCPQPVAVGLVINPDIAVVAFDVGIAGGQGFSNAPDFTPVAPIVGAAAQPHVPGAWMVGADGGVFSLGVAPFYGSAATFHLAAPVTGIAATPSGRGYWLVAADGGVFTFGDAQFLGRP